MKLLNLAATLLALTPLINASPSLRGLKDPKEGEVEEVSLQGQNADRSLQATVPTTGGITFYYTTRYHKIRDLCWPGNTQVDAVTKYQGRLCDDGFSIVWESMKTVEGPDSDEAIGDCEWSRSNDLNWNAEFLGKGCGDSADNMALPRNTLETSVSTFWDFKSHQDPNLCWNGTPGTIAKVHYVGSMCPDDRSKVIWNSIMTVDANGDAITCSNGLKAVWSRHDYDYDRDSEYLKEYFGSCGVAPSKFSSLRTTV